MTNIAPIYQHSSAPMKAVNTLKAPGGSSKESATAIGIERSISMLFQKKAGINPGVARNQTSRRPPTSTRSRFCFIIKGVNTVCGRVVSGCGNHRSLFLEASHYETDSQFTFPSPLGIEVCFPGLYENNSEYCGGVAWSPLQTHLILGQ